MMVEVGHEIFSLAAGVRVLRSPLQRLRRWEGRLGREGERHFAADRQHLSHDSFPQPQATHPGDMIRIAANPVCPYIAINFVYL